METQAPRTGRHEPVVHVHDGELELHSYRAQMVIVHVQVPNRPSYEQNKLQSIDRRQREARAR